MNQLPIGSVSAEPTRDKVLQAAVEVFARLGFRDATVREICAKAEVNVASVNYYFRSKEALYAQALSFAFHQAELRYPLDAIRDPAVPAELRLKEFIQVLIARLLDDTCLGDHGRLIAREIADPTKALDEIVVNWIRPNFFVLSGIVSELLGSAPRCPTEIQRFVLSVLGQCLMYKHSRSIIDRVCPEVIADSSQIDLCAEHIARFSLAALQQLSSKGTQTP